MNSRPKILFYSETGASLPIAWRMRRMGFEVAVFIAEKQYRKCYQGILPEVPEVAVFGLVDSADLVVWDEDLHSINQRVVKAMDHKNQLDLNAILGGFSTIQNQHLMDGDLGPDVACQGSLMSHNPARPCGRPNADAIYGMLSLIDGDWTELFTDGDVKFKEGCVASQRVTIGPYPYLNIEGQQVEIESDLSKLPWFWAQDVARVNGKWVSAGADGLLGVAAGVGNTPNEAWGRCYQHIKSLKINASIQYRRDGLRSARREVEKRSAKIAIGAKGEKGETGAKGLKGVKVKTV